MLFVRIGGMIQGVIVTITRLYLDRGGPPLSVTLSMIWAVSVCSAFGAVTTRPIAFSAWKVNGALQVPASGYWNQ